MYVTLNPGKMLLNDTRPRGTCHAQTEFLKNDLADKEGLHGGVKVTESREREDREGEGGREGVSTVQGKTDCWQRRRRQLGPV